MIIRRIIRREKLNYILLYFILSIVCLTQAKAQEIDFKFDNYTIENGLSNNRVYSILQDREGFLWIGTLNGLNRYDGYRFKSYKNDPNNKNSLGNNRIKEIYEDERGYLWLAGKNSGLTKFDKRNQVFTNYTHIEGDLNSIPENEIISIYESKNKELIIRTKNSSCIYDYNTDQFKITNRINEPSTCTHLDYKPILDRYLDGPYSVGQKLCDTYGNIWIATDKKGLLRINEDSTVINYYSIIGDVKVTQIYQDNSGIIWIGTYGNGIFKHIPETERFAHYSQFNDEYQTIKKINVRAICKDDFNNYWIGTYSQGLLKFNPDKGSFSKFNHVKSDKFSLPSNRIRSIYQDNSGNLWVGTYKGISRYDYSTNQFHNYEFCNKSNGADICDQRVYNIVQDENGYLWIANWDNLIKLNPKDYSYTTISKDTLGLDNIRKVFIDQNNKLWIGAEFGGFSVLNIETDKVIKNSSVYFEYLKGKNIFDIFQDSNGTTWFATFNGLFALAPNSGKVSRIREFDKYPSNMIYGVKEDNNNMLWITTANGLLSYNLNDSSIQLFDSRDGLQSNEFLEGAIHFDKKSNEVIVGGVNGFNIFNADHIVIDTSKPNIVLTSFKIANQEITPFKSYNKRVLLPKPIEFIEEITVHSIQDRVISFEFAALHLENPEKNQYAYILEGFDDKYNYVDASNRQATYTNLSPGKYKFKVIATNSDGHWNTQGKTVSLIVKPAIWQTLFFKLFIIISGLIGFVSFHKIRQRDLLAHKKMLENQIIEGTLQIQMANKGLKEKNEEILDQKKELLKQKFELELHRNNLEGLIYERTQELIIAKNKAEESNRLKTAFLENLSHEIRTPMNAILGFVSLINDDDITPQKSAYLEIIKNNTIDLLKIITDLIDLSNIQTGQIEVVKSDFKVNSIVEELFDTFYTSYGLDNNKKIEFKAEYDDEDTLVNSDLGKCRQIISQFLNNAIKFTSNGSIEIGSYKRHEHIYIYVKDTGIGISEDKQREIFENFKKIEKTGKKFYPGLGIGLSISKHLAELLQGEIYVTSKVDEGSVFTLKLPLISNPPEEPTHRSLTNTKASNKKKQAIIAVDNNEDYCTLQNILYDLDIHVIKESSGIAALFNSKNKVDVDLIIMDLKFLGHNGSNVLTQARNAGLNIPIFVPVSDKNMAKKGQILELGFTDYIEKPFVNKNIHDILKKHLR